MAKNDKVILVTGSTGTQGGAVTRCLLKNGWKVRCLTRDVTKPAARELANLDADVVSGNLDDVPSIRAALNGCYGAFSVQDYYGAGEQGEIRQGKGFAQCCRDTGVEHLVYSSVGSADRNTGIPHFNTKWQIEQFIRGLGIPCTILRPAFFMDNFWNYQKDGILNGTLSLPLPPDCGLQMIAACDIGAFTNLALENPGQYLGKAIDLAGDSLTLTQVARYIGDAIGREVRFVEQSIEAVRSTLPELATMYEWFNDVGYNVDIPGLRGIYPALLDFRGYLKASPWAKVRQTVMK